MAKESEKRDLRVSIAKIAVLSLSMLFSEMLYSQKFYLTGGAFNELYFNTPLVTLDAGILLHPDKRIGFGGEISGYKFFAKEYSSMGTGAGPVLTIRLFQGSNFKLFMFIKGAIVYLFPEYPKEALNYSLFVGPCYERTILKSKTLTVSAGYCHLSNGKNKGQIRNNDWDGFGCKVSCGWF